MIKIVVELDPTNLYTLIPEFDAEDFFNKVKKIEVTSLLKIDLVKGVKMSICDVYLEDGVELKDIPNSEALSWQVLAHEGSRFICVAKFKYKKDSLALMTQFNFENIGLDVPIILTRKKAILPIIGSEAAVKQILDLMKAIVQVKVVSLQSKIVVEGNILALLTERQRDVLLLAKKRGYYEIPRKITTEELAQELSISSTVFLEHLRKAEKRILSNLLVGQ